MRIIKLLAGLAFIMVVISLAVSWFYSPSYNYQERKLPETFEEYYAQKLSESRDLNVRPGNEEKLIRKVDGKSKVAFLYIHGYSASRAEGAYVVDRVADSLNANVYYIRLPGHGTNAEDHAQATFKDYLDESETALRMVQLLSESVVVIGTSMGGLIATYLAAQHPDLVDGLILCSPFFEFASRAGKLLRFPGTLKLIEWKEGPYRVLNSSPEFDSRKQPGYENFWLTKQKYIALQSLEDLRAFAAKKKIFKKVSCPVLLLYYYKDDQHQDRAASVEAMLNAYGLFTNSAKQKIAIEDGDHILTSEYVRTDKEKILKAMLGFRISE